MHACTAWTYQCLNSFAVHTVATCAAGAAGADGATGADGASAAEFVRVARVQRKKSSVVREKSVWHGPEGEELQRAATTAGGTCVAFDLPAQRCQMQIKPSLGRAPHVPRFVLLQDMVSQSVPVPRHSTRSYSKDSLGQGPNPDFCSKR